MKLHLKLILFSFLFIFNSCNLVSTCNECFTPPETFNFNLIDKETQKSIFLSDNYNSNEIEIIKLEDSSSMQFNFIAEGEYRIINIYPIGWITEKITALVKISGQNIFSFYVDAER